jgi:hypothetical protein
VCVCVCGGGGHKQKRDKIKFDIQRSAHRDIVLQYNQREALISQIYFWIGTLHVSDRFSVYHQASSTVYTATGIRHTGYADCLLAGSGWN